LRGDCSLPAKRNAFRCEHTVSIAIEREGEFFYAFNADSLWVNWVLDKYKQMGNNHFLFETYAILLYWWVISISIKQNIISGSKSTRGE
jgi:hypothetical protein